MAHAARTTFLAGILAVLAAAAMQEGSRASFAATLSGPAVHASMGATPDGDHGAFSYLEFEGRSGDLVGSLCEVWGADHRHPKGRLTHAER
jgi:hypothetical protein